MFSWFGGFRMAPKKVWVRLIKDEEAPSMAEYALLLALIALLVFLAIVTLGDGLSTFFSAAGSALGGAQLPTIP